MTEGGVIDIDVRIVTEHSNTGSKLQDTQYVVLTISNSRYDVSKIVNGDALFVPFKKKRQRMSVTASAAQQGFWSGGTKDVAHVSRMQRLWLKHRPTAVDVINCASNASNAAQATVIGTTIQVSDSKTRDASNTSTVTGSEVIGEIGPSNVQRGAPVKTSTGLGLPLCRSFALAGGGWAGIVDSTVHAGSSGSTGTSMSHTKSFQGLLSTLTPTKERRQSNSGTGMQAAMMSSRRFSMSHRTSVGQTGSVSRDSGMTQFWAVIAVKQDPPADDSSTHHANRKYRAGKPTMSMGTTQSTMMRDHSDVDALRTPGTLTLDSTLKSVDTVNQ